MRWKVPVLLFVLLLLCAQSVMGAGFVIYYDGEAHVYDAAPIILNVNGKDVAFDMPPIILQDRTLVPLRGVFEGLGAQVSWFEKTREIRIVLGEDVVVMSIDSPAATVNGKRETMDVPAKLMNDRTMIPVRFVSEALGYQVDWNEGARIVSIKDPAPAASFKTEVINVEVQKNKEHTTAVITASEPITSYDSFLLNIDNLPRVVVDINDAKLTDLRERLAVNDKTVKQIRFSQYQDNPYTTRVVLDLQKLETYTVTQSADKKKLYIQVNSTQSETPPVDVPNQTAYVLSPEARDKLVVIDAGHGGEEPGSIGYIDGNPALYEKEVNLDISLRMNSLLQAAGVKTYMMRTEDTTVGLYDRPKIANSLGADLFISVHSNSFTSPQASGTTTLYYPGEGAVEIYGISSRRLAEIVQEELVGQLGTQDRKLMNGEKMVVLYQTAMPAVIAEVAFLSSPDDLAKLMSEEFRQKAAQGLCNAVIRALNESVSAK